MERKICTFCAADATGNICTNCGKDISEYKPAPHHLQPGTILAGKYMVGGVLGEGGFGITYIGRDTILDMTVAIKEYFPSGVVNRNNTISAEITSPIGEAIAFFEKGKKSFLDEARILAKFSNEQSIVSVRDFFSENNTAYIVMEYLEGVDLKTFIEKNGAMDFKSAVDMLSPVMTALSKIHSQGLIHRDISPSNIMILNDGTVKLLDFGAAREVSGADEKSLSILLKPGYAPEEQYRTKGKQGPWTDVYAISATMYKILTGITPDDAMNRLFSDELKSPTELGITIDPVAEKALLKGLSITQKERYQSITELLRGFQGMDLAHDDSKTVYGSVESGVDIDKPTTYKASVSNDDLVFDNRDVTVYKNKPETKNAAMDCNAEEEPPIYNHLNPTPNRDAIINKSKKQRKKNKNIGIVLLSAVLLIVAIIGFSTIFNALGSVTIGGEKVDKNDTRIHLNNKTITVDDMKAIASMGKLSEISFSNCAIDNGAFEFLSNISAPVTEFKLHYCTGIDDYGNISELKYLQQLDIIGCGLTNEQLKKIKLDKCEYLNKVYLSENATLSDISSLGSVKLLNEIVVDKTAVVDFSVLKNCEVLQSVSAQACGITDIATLTNKTITHLFLDDNAIADISSFSNFEALNTLEIGKNKISDISALKDKKILTTLHLDENQITDISVLATTPYLLTLQVSDNQITSLQALSSAEELTYLYVNRNKITNLDGLENSLKLKSLQATENQIENINGISNCTILEEVNINDNKVTDISLLGKSASTLKRVFFNNNNVADISCLANTGKLEYLSFDNNKVVTLDSLKDSTSLLGISAENNGIESMLGLANSTQLKYIYLAHNKINDMSPVANLAVREPTDFAIVDVSSNQITELKANTVKKYTYLAVYNNPIKSFDKVAELDGAYFLFSYVSGMDFAGFKDAFNQYNVIDCPKDEQVSVKTAIYGSNDYMSITNGLAFSTVEEADEQTRKAKDSILIGSTKPEDTQE